MSDYRYLEWQRCLPLAKYRITSPIPIGWLTSLSEMTPAKSHLPSLSPQPSHHPSIALILRCRTAREAAQIHAHLITTGLLRHPAVLLSLSSSSRPPLRRLLLSPPPPSPFLWNSLIKTSPHSEAFLLFSSMLSHGVLPDRFSFSLILKSCSRASLLSEGLQIHALLVKSGLHSDLFLQNSLISFYCNFLLLAAARQMFDRMPERDSISCNLIINGYSAAGKMISAREIFDRMAERSSISWNSMICGYARSDQIDAARSLFDEMPERDSFSWNSMIDGLVKSGRMTEAVELFERMPEKNMLAEASIIYGYMESGNPNLARSLFDEMLEKDLVTWNIMISGYVKNGYFREALSLFLEMSIKSSLLPDDVTLAAVLSAIAELGQIRRGISVHEYIQRKKLSLSGKLGVALIDMYSKCGRLEEALKIFEICRSRSVDHWNAMIGGLAIHGYGRLALKLFHEMIRLSIQPDDITFIEILKACSHAGLVEQGLEFFSAMEQEYKINPKIQHYGCVVDILGRSGRIDDAKRLIEEMPMSPNAVVWRSLLSACKNHGKIELGQTAEENLLRNSVHDPSSYVLLSNLYSRCKMWRDSRKIREAMKVMDLRKLPGCSWIELDFSVYEFTVGG